MGSTIHLSNQGEIHVRRLLGLVLSTVVLFVAGCGGSGSGSPPGGATVSGVVAKGPVSGATVSVFAVISSATSNPRANIPRLGTTALASATTTSGGSFSLQLPATFTTGSIYVTADGTGASYTDEATNATTNLSTTFPNGLHAIFGNISGAAKRGAITVSVTPFTEMAYQDASVANVPTDGQIVSSNLAITNAIFGQNSTGVNIVSTEPVNPFASSLAGATSAQQAYAVKLAALSQYSLTNEETAGTATSSLLAQIQAHSYVLPPATATALTAATFTVFSSNSALNSGLKNNPAANPTAPASLAVTPSATSAAINTGSISVAATVLTSSGGAVPNGTPVNFTTTVGSLSSSSATTTNGVATVALTSSTPGSGAVTATCGAQTAATTAITGTITFTNPNAPGAVTLISSSATGSTAATGGVTLTATVTPVSNAGTIPNGTLVTFTITSGSGTLSAVTTTTSGVATATLNATTANTVTVTATAGTLTSSAVSVAFKTQPTLAIVKLNTTGTLPAATLIGGITATLTYPNTGLTIAPAAISATGVAVGSVLTPNANTAGQVILGLLNTTGLPIGEWATLTFTIQAGSFPTAASFAIAPGASVISEGTTTIPGISVGIESVTIQ